MENDSFLEGKKITCEEGTLAFDLLISSIGRRPGGCAADTGREEGRIWFSLLVVRDKSWGGTKITHIEDVGQS